MNKIQQLLQAHNIEITEAEISRLCAEAGVDIEQLSDSDAQTITQHIIEERQVSGKLAKNSNKPKNNNGKLTKNSSRRKSVPNLEGAISKASQVSNEEIQSLEDVLNAGIDAYTTDKADQLLSSIRNAPKEVVRKFTQAAMEEEADVESFRDIGEQLVRDLRKNKVPAILEDRKRGSTSACTKYLEWECRFSC
ncbi:MAG: hypothetical protein MET45_29960 [Nostoc sp. LLA-1]|nr:hypothetical protein [Cyanocohniella sp. LLY]